MANVNLIKQIAKRVKEITCPIMEELREQSELIKFNKTLAKFRNFENQKVQECLK